MIELLTAAAAGCMVGILLTWLVLRARTREIAVRTKAEAESERATLLERVQARDQQLEESKTDLLKKEEQVMSLQVEMRLLGDDEGRMAFRAGVSQWLESTGSGNEIGGVSTSLLDSAPDAGVSWGLVR